MLISIETHITCDFPGGGSRPPIPPLDPHLNTRIYIVSNTLDPQWISPDVLGPNVCKGYFDDNQGR